MAHANPDDTWDADFTAKSPLFADLVLLLNGCGWSDWPDCRELMKLADEILPGQPENLFVTAEGIPLRFVTQDKSLPFPQLGYEERIFKSGIIATRKSSWHDFFNALIWMLFPRSKQLLNKLHMQELEQQEGKKRTPMRDAITHLDESGVVIASAVPELVEHIRRHEWEDIFIEHRKDWGEHIQMFIFGHGLYEKAFRPYIGMTAKACFIDVEEDFFRLERLRQYTQLDQMLSVSIQVNNLLQNPRGLSPLPLLGVPDWWEENNNPAFYNDKNYFR